MGLVGLGIVALDIQLATATSARYRCLGKEQDVCQPVRGPEARAQRTLVSHNCANLTKVHITHLTSPHRGYAYHPIHQGRQAFHK